MTKVPMILPTGQGAFRLPSAKPWGRNRAEYSAFFGLNNLAPGLAILDCAAGPSSFTVEMRRRGFAAVAADPIYAEPPDRIRQEIEDAREIMLAGLRSARSRFVWDSYGSPEDLEATRRSTMKHFLKDLEEDRDGRYVAAALPRLPFAAKAFDLVLCSHFLFLYSGQFDLAFHLSAIRELCRVAREVRIFPLLDLEGRPSAHLEAVRRELDSLGWQSEVRPVDYEFQKGGNRMLWAQLVEAT